MNYQILPSAFHPYYLSAWAEEFSKCFDQSPPSQQSGIRVIEHALYNNFEHLIKSAVGLPSGYLWLADYCSVRQQLPYRPSTALPWHTDAAVVLGKRFGWIDGYVAWVPLNTISPLTPSLKLCLWQQPLVHFGNKKTGYLEAICPPIGPRKVIDNLTLGTALLFNINLPHKTYITSSMTQTRMSLDLRLVKKVPANYHGRVVEI